MISSAPEDGRFDRIGQVGADQLTRGRAEDLGGTAVCVRDFQVSIEKNDPALRGIDVA